jgi:hypothetical protein
MPRQRVIQTPDVNAHQTQRHEYKRGRQHCQEPMAASKPSAPVLRCQVELFFNLGLNSGFVHALLKGNPAATTRSLIYQSVA